MDSTFPDPETLVLNPQSLQATVCCYVGAAALVHLRPGGPGLPNRGFNYWSIRDLEPMIIHTPMITIM